MLKAFPFVYKFFYHIHGCAVVGLYCFEAIRPEYHEVSNLIQVFLFTYLLTPFRLPTTKTVCIQAVPPRQRQGDWEVLRTDA